LATVSLDETSAPRAERKKSRRRKTSHLKLVPETRAQREHLRSRCAEVAAKLDKTHALGKDEMERVSRQLLEEEGLGEGFVGWTMVNLSSEFWREQVAATPYDRRLLLLPHCLKHAEGCPADYDEFGLDCRQCGACSIADFRGQAEDMGYKVLVAEGSPIVLKIIVSGHVDAIVGVACLNVLEKAIDKILIAGIPCMAVPLLSSDCRNTSVDEEWVDQMITLTHEKPQTKTRSYLHLMRSASSMFETEQLDHLAPRLRGGPRLAEVNGQGATGLDPIACTEAIAFDFLSKGGKHSRPFITLATYDALTGAKATLPDGAVYCNEFTDSVRRAAMSIETFHKASLVHDDIEDDDGFRYGDETLHRKYGTPTAINIGDYLIGLGYRLVSRETEALGHEAVADIVNTLADAHMRLSEGQGAELIWRDSLDKQLKPIDALKIYALKTAPAFEAAVLTGIRLAGDVRDYIKPVGQFARHLGVAFQILNDLKDWNGDEDNKLGAGLDVLGGRPTVLLALALEGLEGEQRDELLQLIQRECPTEQDIERARALYESADVFEKAHRLVDKYQDRAEEIADEIEPEELRRLFYYLIDNVLDRVGTEQPDVEPAVVDIAMPGS
jgi:geranylgeranyl pyrophosphate synthase